MVGLGFCNPCYKCLLMSALCLGLYGRERFRVPTPSLGLYDHEFLFVSAVRFGLHGHESVLVTALSLGLHKLERGICFALELEDARLMRDRHSRRQIGTTGRTYFGASAAP